MPRQVMIWPFPVSDLQIADYMLGKNYKDISGYIKRWV